MTEDPLPPAPPPPRIAMVTPVLDQDRYLPACMDSILGQRYPALEYVVVDGGSSDGCAAIVKERAAALAGHLHGVDRGPYDAVNRGFALTSGEIMGWLNGDDLLLPGTLALVSHVFAAFPGVHWLTTLMPAVFNARGDLCHVGRHRGFSRRAFLRGANHSGHGGAFIQQESTFWRRSLWEAAGGALDTSFELAADFDLWARFFRHAPLHGIAAVLGGFRLHGNQRSVLHRATYHREADRILRREGGRVPGSVESSLRHQLHRALALPSASRLARRLFRAPVLCWDGDRWALGDGVAV